jgi:hypothetical protein
MSFYFYSRTKDSLTKRCLVSIEPTTDVELAIYDYLRKNKQDPSQYLISEIEPACEGCLNEYLGQKDHMSCPYGCLHDANNCTLCM